LLKAGANPNAKAPDGSTLLHQAAQAANLDMIRALADAHVKFDEPNKDGLTALDVAEGKQPRCALPTRCSRRSRCSSPLVALVAEVDAVVEQLRKTSPNYSANSWVCRQHRPHLQHRKRLQKLHPLETAMRKGLFAATALMLASIGLTAQQTPTKVAVPPSNGPAKPVAAANAGRVSGDAEQILRHLPQPEG
jgi:ankyrin repeat protein